MTSRGQTAGVGLALLAAVLVGILAPAHPLTALGMLLLPVAVPLIVISSWFRLSVVVIGALAVFQSTASSAKIAYLGLAVLCVGISLANLSQVKGQVIKNFGSMLGWSVPLLIWLLGTGFIAHSNGTSLTDWFRDVLGYLLLVLLPIVGLDVARDISADALGKCLGWLGVISAAAIAADWLNRRGASTETGRFILGSSALSTFALCYTLLRASLGPRRIIWSLASGVSVVALLITGTRTNLVLLAIAAVAMVGSKRNARVPLKTIVGSILLGVPAVIYLLPRIAGAFLTNSQFLTDRYLALQAVLHGGLKSDQSFLSRESQYQWTSDWFREHPILGGGPGHSYPNGLFTVDSPLAIPAKLGVIGCALLLAYFWAIVKALRASRSAPDPAFTATWAWWLILVALIPFGPLIEDKGTSLTLALMVCLCVAVAREHSGGDPAIEAKNEVRFVSGSGFESPQSLGGRQGGLTSCNS